MSDAGLDNLTVACSSGLFLTSSRSCSRSSQGVDGVWGLVGIVGVLVGVQVPVWNEFQEIVKRSGNQATDKGAKPVHPVRMMEFSNDSRPKSTSGVHCRSRVDDGEQMTSEQGKANPNGCERSASVFLGSKHKNRQAEVQQP